MEMKNGINNCQLIEDYYNSDPGSLGMALEYLKSQNNRKTTLILSDFVQSGRDEGELYSEVAGLVKKTGINKFKWFFFNLIFIFIYTIAVITQ
jgi:alanine racemase